MVLGSHHTPFAEAVASITADTLLVSVDTDFLTPPQQLQMVHDIIAREGTQSKHEVGAPPPVLHATRCAAYSYSRRAAAAR